MLGGVLAAVEITGYQQRGRLLVATGGGEKAPLPHDWYSWATPWWAYLLAVAVGLMGLLLGVLIYRRGGLPPEAVRVG